MTKKRRENGRRGAGLAMRIAATVSVAMAIVMVTGALLLFTVGRQAMVDEFDRACQRAVEVAAKGKFQWEQTAPTVRLDARTEKVPVLYMDDGGPTKGRLYRHATSYDARGQVTRWTELFVPDEHVDRLARSFFSLVVAIAVFMVVASVWAAVVAAKRGVRPLRTLLADVEVISRGRLDHPIRVSGGGEVGQLTSGVDRMIKSLREARETERDLERRDHDLKIASEVRESLLPKKIPALPGYEIAGSYRPAEEAGGDLYDLLEVPDGQAGILVAEVSGKGVTASLLMATARAYLRTEAARAPGPREALIAANRFLAPDMRRGLFVSALYAVLDPKKGTLRVASAGHKVPLLRYAAADSSLRAVHAEGIALGFDPGPVFERTLVETEVPLEPGDRAVLMTTGAFAVRNPDEAELGEKGVYAIVKREAPKNSEAFVNFVLAAAERYAGGRPFPADVVVATVKRLPA